MLDVRQLVQIVVSLLVFFLIVWLLHYLIIITPIPAPYHDWVILAYKILVVLTLIGFILNWSRFPFIKK